MSDRPSYGDVIEVRAIDEWYPARHMSDARGGKEFFASALLSDHHHCLRYDREGRDWRWPATTALGDGDTAA